MSSREIVTLCNRYPEPSGALDWIAYSGKHHKSKTSYCRRRRKPSGVGGDKVRKEKRKVGMSGMPETGSRAHARLLLRNDDVSAGVRCQTALKMIQICDGHLRLISFYMELDLLH